MPLLEPPTLTANQRTAKQVLEGPNAIFCNLFQNWKIRFEQLWRAQDPQGVLDELGTNAGEVFLLSSQLVGFLETLKPGCTAETLAIMKPVTINPDGSATIDVPPVEEETPVEE